MADSVVGAEGNLSMNADEFAAMRARLKDEVWIWWDYYFGHKHKYSLVHIAIYKGEPRENPRGIPLVAWIYECKCGKEIVELDSSGIRLLQKGVDYEELIKERI